mgnify:CR=1 FL=1
MSTEEAKTESVVENNRYPILRGFQKGLGILNDILLVPMFASIIMEATTEQAVFSQRQSQEYHRAKEFARLLRFLFLGLVRPEPR